MKTVIKHIKLPLNFDTHEMLEEVKKLTSVSLPHYNKNDYTGSWTAIPLRSINGETTQAFAHPNQQYADTIYMQKCPNIKATVDTFQCEKLSVRVLNLQPNATIKTHIDQGLFFEDGEIRIHIPLQTNELVEFILDNEAMYLKDGECWYMNFNLNHNLANNGSEDRIHLVIDCIVNDWVRELFDSTPIQHKKYIEVQDGMTDDAKLEMIEQLKLIGTETALAIAVQKEKELLNKQ